jgi:hypothetical protein
VCIYLFDIGEDVQAERMAPVRDDKNMENFSLQTRNGEPCWRIG